MCGIAGIVDFSQPPSRELASNMAKVLVHRGPDEAGAYSDDTCSLAMRRLAIQDVMHGHQPVSDETGSIFAVMNGEIYNFLELRKELEAKGHRLASASDTEVIPHLYEEYGSEFLHHLRGMFAIALWDAGRETLLLARDRLGKKPLFLTTHHGSIRFASEIKAFFVDRSIPREPDPIAIHHYLTLQYVPAPLTAFQGIESLEPGHLVELSRGGRVGRRWWTPQAAEGVANRTEAAERTRALLEESVRLRLISDVPLGAFLSGGIDSSCVVATMASLSSTPVRTFTIVFDEKERDERAMARLVSERFGTEHTEHLVTPDTMSLLPLMAWHFDQPLADHALLPTYLVARETRRDVKVALNGDGGDEAFAGYPRIRRLSARRGAPFAWLDRSIQRIVPATSDPSHPASLFRREVTRRLGGLGGAYAAGVEVFPEAQRGALYTPSMKRATMSASTLRLLEGAWTGEGDTSQRARRADYTTYLPGALLPKVDLATMATSLEARSPMLDHRFVEFALGLPLHLVVGDGRGKQPLRDAFRGEVPTEVLDSTKRGFGLPLAGWFRNDRAFSRQILTGRSSAITRYIDAAAVRRLLDAHDRGRDHSVRIFSLLMLELWLQTYVASPPSLTPPGEASLSDIA